MTTRPYHQRLRAESADQTRRRILDAVARRLRRAPTDPLSLDEVAELARVARSTIYVVFGSRAGLFDAFVEDLWARTGLPALTEAVGHPDAHEHLRGGIAAANRMYAADPEIYRVLHSMAKLDPTSVGGAVDKMQQERAGGLAHVARRLGEAGLLRDDVTVDEAADVLWMVCSFESFDALHARRGLDVEEVTAIMWATAERTLLSAAP